MIKNGILFLIASLIFASCIHIVEDNTTIVKGYIREIRSGKPIEGAGAYLSFKPFLKPEETITHFDNISDSNGYYEIKFEADRGNGYKIAIGRQGYYCNQCNEPVKSGEENTLNVYLVPTAEFTLNLINEPPQLRLTRYIFAWMENSYHLPKKTVGIALAPVMKMFLTNLRLKAMPL